MKIYLMTDLEGVAGVLNFHEWVFTTGMFFYESRKLLTMEANAAVEGFFAGGASEVVVAAGHGGGSGAIDTSLLDPRAKFQRGWPKGPYPLGLDKSYDAVAFVGQHAKAGTEYAHLAHTQNLRVIDLSVNDISVGEFGQTALCAGELDIPVIFGSGDKAFTKEAIELIPGIETVTVKEGLMSGKGDECSEEEYTARNAAAIHLHPETARKLIRKGAKKSIERLIKERFGIVKIQPPYKLVYVFRADEKNPQTTKVKTHPSSISELMNKPFD